MMVLGATFPEELKAVRELCPEIPFLVPGVGAQGGDVEKVVSFGRRADGYASVLSFYSDYYSFQFFSARAFILIGRPNRLMKPSASFWL